MSLRNRSVAVLCSLALLVVALAAPQSAGAKVPTAPRSYSSAIETLAPYQPQHRCAQYHRVGVTKLSRLLTLTYRGTTYYTLRPCASDTSEHYDGRAIDWMTSVSVPWQHADAHDFLTWLLAKDKYGNAFAMARRLGIMYVIFNNRMWGAWDGKWQDYNGCMAKKMQAPQYANACHRTHVHISLAWKGAFGQTSFWTGRVAHYPGG